MCLKGSQMEEKVSQSLVETTENQRETVQIPSAVYRLSAPKDMLDIYQTQTALKRCLPVIWGAAGVHSAAHLAPLCTCV